MATSNDHVQADDGLGLKFFVEKGITIFPLLVTLVAVTFDVGTFVSFGLGWFTFFSLTEHLAFAFAALPTALVICFAGLLMVPGVLMIRSVPRNPAKWTWQTLSREKQTAVILVLFILFVVVIGGFVWIVRDMYLGWPRSAASSMFLLMTFPPALPFLLLDNKHRRLFVFPFVTYTILAASFALGASLGQAWTEDADMSNLSSVTFKDGNRTQAKLRVIRSGDRGVLLYDPAARLLRFERWDDIRSIERTKAYS